MHFLPWLYNSFIETLEKDKNNKKRFVQNKKEDEQQRISLDFDFFVEMHLMVKPQLSSPHAMRCINKCLKIIDKYNVYSPSDDIKQVTITPCEHSETHITNSNGRNISQSWRP